MVRVETYDEAVDLVNASPYGDGAAIFTNDGGVARRFQNEVEVGMVGINVPIPLPKAYYSFGGWKASLFGDGHAHSAESVHFFTRTKTVTSRWLDSSHGGIELGFPQSTVLFWPVATRLAAQAALVVGFLAGLSWYHLGGWDPTMFHYGIHPVWVGMSLNITTLLLVTMTTSTWRLATRPVHRRRGALALLAALALAAVTVASWDLLHPLGLSGLAIFTIVALTASAAFQLVRQPLSVNQPRSNPEDHLEEGVETAGPPTTRATIR